MNCVKTYATKPRWESLWSVSQKIEKTCPIFCCCSRSKALGIGAEHFLSAPTERQNVAGSLRSSPKEFSPEEEKPGWEPSPLSWSDWEGGMAESGDSCRVGFVCRAERMSLRHCRLLRGRSRSKAHIWVWHSKQGAQGLCLHKEVSRQHLRLLNNRLMPRNNISLPENWYRSWYMYVETTSVVRETSNDRVRATHTNIHGIALNEESEIGSSWIVNGPRWPLAKVLARFWHLINYKLCTLVNGHNFANIGS